jgi:hypothetical protein
LRRNAGDREDEIELEGVVGHDEANQSTTSPVPEEQPGQAVKRRRREHRERERERDDQGWALPRFAIFIFEVSFGVRRERSRLHFFLSANLFY